MKTFLLNISLIFVMSCVWSACGSDDRALEQRLFGNMDSLLEADPDSAYVLLKAMQSKVDSIGDEPLSMRHSMFMASAENKLYLQMPADSDFMDVVAYYDLHGTANDRMKAYYLLGCIYRDRRDGPASMRMYQKAVDCADTLEKECDYNTLYKIYGQMSALYEGQFLYKEARESAELYSKYAEKAGNITECVRGEEMQIPLYLALADTLRMFQQTSRVHDKYLSMNRPDLAARVYPTAIYTYLKQGEYSKAHELMDIFEEKSGLFDEKGEISARYSRYYLSQGMYHQAVGQIDSAETCFRKLLKCGHEYEAYNHLWCLYNVKNNPDSIRKYTALLNECLDRKVSSVKTPALRHIMKEHGQGKEDGSGNGKARENRRTAFFIILLLSALSGSAGIFIIKRRRRQNSKEKGKNSGIPDQTKKEDSVKELTKKGIADLYNSEPVQKLRNILNSKKEDCYPTDQLWDELIKATSDCTPNFLAKVMQGKQKLSRQEIIVAILVLLYFTTSECAILFNVSGQRISNIKRIISDKLFHHVKTDKLYQNLRKLA